LGVLMLLSGCAEIQSTPSSRSVIPLPVLQMTPAVAECPVGTNGQPKGSIPCIIVFPADWIAITKYSMQMCIWRHGWMDKETLKKTCG